jgi:hypothetical protein
MGMTPIDIQRSEGKLKERKPVDLWICNPGYRPGRKKQCFFLTLHFLGLWTLGQNKFFA